MEKGIYVKDIMPPCEAGGVFVVSQASQGSSRNGPFWRLCLSDSTGSIEAMLWPPLSEGIACDPTGRIVLARGRAGIFREQPQLKLESIEVLAEGSAAALDPAFFVPAGPNDPAAMFQELQEICRQEFQHPPWRTFVFSVLGDESLAASFRLHPAAKSIHHAYTGGLLEHSLGVMRLCLGFCGQYPELDRQTLLAGALFHDIGKIREFSGGIANDYTAEGRLFGHLALGVEMMLPYLAQSGLEAHLSEHFRHLLLSHHGELAYGAVRQPQTPEAFALHFADNMDARMAQCRSLFGQTEEAPAWTPWQRSLDRALFRPLPTPTQPRERKNPRKEECLSLLKA